MKEKSKRERLMLSIPVPLKSWVHEQAEENRACRDSAARRPGWLMSSRVRIQSGNVPAAKAAKRMGSINVPGLGRLLFDREQQDSAIGALRQSSV